MSGKVLFILLPFLVFLSFKKDGTDPPSLKILSGLYERADRFFNSSHAGPATDSAALKGFREVIGQLASFEKGDLVDSLLFQCYFKEGILLEMEGKFEEATPAYLHALAHAPDESRKLKMYVFAGAGYYNQNNFDSANYFLLKAEENPGGNLQAEDQVRLYNTLGVLYYDNGNYLLAKNYFNQAFSIIQKNNPADRISGLSLQLNMATCFFRLGLYNRALGIYQSALRSGLFSDQIYMNIGRAYAGLHRYPEAMASFRKVNAKKLPGVWNEMAEAYLESGHADSARLWLEQFRYEKNKLKVNTLDAGVNALYFGDLELYRKDPGMALPYLQEAVILFSGNFKDTATRNNPAGFTGSFAYYKLFDALYKKATAWQMLYKETSMARDLQSAYDTYQSAISLLTYIERSYEMDDAKILLKQKSARVYKEALQACIDLYQLFPDRHYLQDAFLISERNKASVMASNLREQNFHFASGKEDDLTRRERNIKFNIARLSIKADQENGEKAVEKISMEKSAYETELAVVQKKMERNSRYYQLKYREDYPSVSTLQGSLEPDQAIISLSNGEDRIHVFVITRSSFRYLKLDSGAAIRENVRSWIQILQSAENGKHADSKNLGNALFAQLVRPLEQLAGDKTDWIIVPDGIFFLLPFESLPANISGDLLIEKHAVSYQFSSRFIPEKESVFMNPGFPGATLSFAPFSAGGADLHKEGMGYFARLPDSKTEISSLPGKQFSDSAATKENFLQSLNRFPIVHLATHAVADLDDPNASSIIFYPATGLRSEDCLFLGELYGLRMDSCRLVIISACETGKGKLVSNEGVMSFARAFLYAGCPSTVNSLWKADDRSTSEILKLFHYYLEKGFSKAKALQQAKLDFIHKNPLCRNPAYWSGLVLTGNADALYKKKQPFYWAVLGLCCCSLAFVFWKKRRKSRRFP